MDAKKRSGEGRRGLAEQWVWGDPAMRVGWTITGGIIMKGGGVEAFLMDPSERGPKGRNEGPSELSITMANAPRR